MTMEVTGWDEINKMFIVGSEAFRNWEGRLSNVFCTGMWKSSRIMNEISNSEISSCSKHNGLICEIVSRSVVFEWERKNGMKVSRTIKFVINMFQTPF